MGFVWGDDPAPPSIIPSPFLNFTTLLCNIEIKQLYIPLIEYINKIRLPQNNINIPMVRMDHSSCYVILLLILK